MTLELSVCTDKEYWDRFVSSSPQGNVFCLTHFLDALDTEYQLWLVRQGQDSQLGAITIKDGEKQLIRNPFMYQGLLFGKKFTEGTGHSQVPNALRVIDFLLAGLEGKFKKISFSLHHQFGDLRSFQWFHYHQPQLGRFKINLQYTGLIGLSAFKDFSDFLASIRTTRRYEYNKAVKDSLKVETSQDIDVLDYLHKLTFQRQDIGRNEDAGRLLRNIATSALSGGFGELLLCRNKDCVISATLYLFDSKCGYYLYGANHPEHRDKYGGTLLMIENIRRCKERGLEWVDVCGINSPNRGDFKVSFNATPTPYFEVIWEKPDSI